MDLSHAKLWSFSAHGNTDRKIKNLPVAAFPTNIHSDLEAAGLIASPFEGRNAEKLFWVQETDWKYECRFQLNELRGSGAWFLVCDGLDTVASIALNGCFLAESSNMFVPVRVHVDSSFLRFGRLNTLEIIFKSSQRVAKELEKENGSGVAWNGDPSRLHLRKAQYHWGWDWGPTFITCGIWKNIRLEFITLKIAALYCRTYLSECLTRGTINFNIDLEVFEDFLQDSLSHISCVVTVHSPDGKLASAKSTKLQLSDNTKSFTKVFSLVCVLPDAQILNPRLWYPAGSGAQPLYKVTATLLHSSSPTPIHVKADLIAFRSVRLIEKSLPCVNDKDLQETSFYFEINNRPVFCQGSNWIPGDSFLSRVDKIKYERYLNLLVACNQNMIRVWGGGVYESDEFYQLCNKLGVLVWQDFMFACGTYPAYESFLDSIKQEARAVLRRLRNYACIVIFTGNNEDYAVAESDPVRFGYDPNCMDEAQWLASKFPARYIYEKILPDIIQELYPEIPYKPGSPWTSKGRPSSSTAAGDLHQWNVWHGMQESYQKYGALSGRFISEFGMQAFPNVETVKMFFPSSTLDSEIQNPFGDIMDFHNKATGFLRKLVSYVYENVRVTGKGEIDDFIYATQLMQSEALSTAYISLRQQWNTDGNRRVGGALVWQLNDCWPCTSWSIVDYYYRPKPAYYCIKRALAPIVLSISRVQKNGRQLCSVWGGNSLDIDVFGTLILKAFEYVSGELLMQEKVENIKLSKNSSMSLLDNICIAQKDEDNKCRVLEAILLDNEGKVVCRCADWPQPLRYLPIEICDRGVEVKLCRMIDKTTAVFCVSVKRPVKGLLLLVSNTRVKVFDSADLNFSDNMIDLFPGDQVEVRVSGWIEGCDIKTKFYV